MSSAEQILRADDLEATVRSLVDKSEITAGKYAFIRAADAGDVERLLTVFAEDCEVWNDPEGPPLVGKDELRAWYTNRLADVTASSHHLSNIEITFDDADTATMYCYFLSWQRLRAYPEKPDRTRYARYVDRWSRRDGRWRQTSLRVLVAGEFHFPGRFRQSEYHDWDRQL